MRSFGLKFYTNRILALSIDMTVSRCKTSRHCLGIFLLGNTKIPIHSKILLHWQLTHRRQPQKASNDCFSNKRLFTLFNARFLSSFELIYPLNAKKYGDSVYNGSWKPRFSWSAAWIQEKSPQFPFDRVPHLRRTPVDVSDWAFRLLWYFRCKTTTQSS